MNELIARLITLFDRLQKFGEAKATPLYNEAVGAMIQQRFLTMVFDVAMSLLLFIIFSVAATIFVREIKNPSNDTKFGISMCIATVSIFTLAMLIPSSFDSITAWLQAYHYPNITFLKTLK